MSCPFAPFVRLAPFFASLVPIAGTFYRSHPKAAIAVGVSGGGAALFLGYVQLRQYEKDADPNAVAPGDKMSINQQRAFQASNAPSGIVQSQGA
eukprot:ANDGO_04466.mRNA.1 hypothetical protein